MFLRLPRLAGVWAALLVGMLLSACGAEELQGVAMPQVQAAPDFTLTTADGQPFRLSEQRGKPVFLFFGYTSCPDVCPTTLADLARAKQQAGKAGENVQVVFVSVDPERDTPERIKRYVSNFDPSFVGLHGTDEQLQPVLKAYGVTAIKRPLPNSKLGYVVDHSSYVAVIDREGQWRELFGFGDPVESIANDMRVLAS